MRALRNAAVIIFVLVTAILTSCTSPAPSGDYYVFSDSLDREVRLDEKPTRVAI